MQQRRVTVSPNPMANGSSVSSYTVYRLAGNAIVEVQYFTNPGTVVSAKTQKTIAVEITRVVKHPVYGKYVRRTTRLLAHDEAGVARDLFCPDQRHTIYVERMVERARRPGAGTGPFGASPRR